MENSIKFVQFAVSYTSNTEPHQRKAYLRNKSTCKTCSVSTTTQKWDLHSDFNQGRKLLRLTTLLAAQLCLLIVQKRPLFVHKSLEVE